MSWITGVGLTPYGRLEGLSTLDLMATAARQAMSDADLSSREIDGLITGYSTTFPHLMLSGVVAEHLGIEPHYATSLQLGGATGFAMVALADTLIEAGIARNVLVVAGENRLSGQSRDISIQTLSQVGHPVYEVPLGPTVPSYYGLLASRYFHDFGADETQLAALAVLMRRNAGRHPGAHLRDPITVPDVLESRPISRPLKLLDSCPISDGGCAVVVSAGRRGSDTGARLIATAQANPHQHVSAATSLSSSAAKDTAARACAAAGIETADVSYAAIYDSFTVTLAILLEDLGLAARGEAGSRAAAGEFDLDGSVPLNTHGGLLSYGHCGVAGALAHLVETQLQMTGRAGERQVRNPSLALLHGDGGVMSSHVSMIMEQAR